MPPTLHAPIRLRRLAARVVLGLAVLVTALVVLSLLGAAADDAAIDARTGRTTAEVISVSSSRTLVRLRTADGALRSPEQGIAYPAGLAGGQLVRVEYAIGNPGLVRVSGRSWVVGLPPAAAVLGVTWLLAPALAWGVRRRRVGAVSRAGLDKDPRDVAAMFDGVARRYDLTNTVLSFGQDRCWRRATREALEARPGERVLDLAAGTAVSTVELAGSGAWCVAVDFSLGMLRAGQHRRVPLVGADALRLPFADGVFDVATISFGLRNVSDPDAALTELVRVTRPGGRLVVCEFSTPTWRPLRTVYLEYLMRALPAVSRRVSSNPDAYGYLADSIRAWPGQRALAERIAAAGWSEVGWRDLTGGIVALHRAVRPGGRW